MKLTNLLLIFILIALLVLILGPVLSIGIFIVLAKPIGFILLIIFVFFFFYMLRETYKDARWLLNNYKERKKNKDLSR